MNTLQIREAMFSNISYVHVHVQCQCPSDYKMART